MHEAMRKEEKKGSAELTLFFFPLTCAPCFTFFLLFSQFEIRRYTEDTQAMKEEIEHLRSRATTFTEVGL